MRRLACVLFALCLLGPGLSSADTEGRALLWRAVQSCILNHNVTGAAFPCEAVDTAAGPDRGYAVIRAPRDDAHVIVMPTVRTIGIEADRLRGADAPNYFELAWKARTFASERLAQRPARDDYALAVNSRVGRSQDQLHIHVACVRADVKSTVAHDLPAIRARAWTTVKLFATAPLYRARYVSDDDLAGENVVDLVAHGLHMTAEDMHDATIAIVPVKPHGFVILARRRIPNGLDEPHAESLLDRSCSAFARK